MYFPIGWPKVIKLPKLGQSRVKQISCNRDRILFSIITDDTLAIWFCKPCVPIVFHRRTPQSLEKFGTNILAEWKPDSSMIVIATSEGHLVFYKLGVIGDHKGLYIQTDSPHANLRRDSAELFIKETIPPLHLTLSDEIMVWDGKITGIECITMSELMVSTTAGHILRYKWDGQQNRDYSLDLRRIPFCINQQVAKAVPIVEENTFVVEIEYSPLVGGYSIVLNDGRAAFLTASSLKFDPNQVQGIWAQGIEDATCTVMNHKYRLITFGRANSECVVYYVDETTGGLEVSHNCVLSSKDYPGDPGPVNQVLWTPDGCALIASWARGGIGMWSTFGALLMCSLGWDYGLNVDIQRNNPLKISSMQFATEGYQLWMVQQEINSTENGAEMKTNLLQLDFLKSALTINSSVNHQSHLYLQGGDKLYVNSADTLVKMFAERTGKDDVFGDSTISLTSTLAEGRQWLVVPVPSTYSATNWPIRYSAIDSDGLNIAIAGRTGLAHYSTQSRRWKLFGNETQEKDFIVAGGLLWWRDQIVVGCYSIIENADELRFYPRDAKLDNKFAKIVSLQSPILLMNILQDQLITFGSDGQLCIWLLRQETGGATIEAKPLQVLDISALAVHPACIVSVTLTSLRTETARGQQHNPESIVLNVSGRLLMVQREGRRGERYMCSMPTVLASCVENVWVPSRRRADKAHLTEALWLFCGAHGMRVWLPLYPKDGDKVHTFMSKRIMLPFHLKIYPLAILFEDAIILGAENDTVLYTSDSNSPFSLPFNLLQRTSQVYLHQILRQLIRRNLGYHAWEIARSCMSLPYFPHSLELLLHEVLEEEATSKEPIPDAQLPSVVEFIMEFPVYLQTVVQCARKTEIALWPYLFSAAGKPKDLFQECMAKRHLDTAASYLIILQNLETSSVSRQYATLLLNTALDQSKWELAKDLVRFLRAIDPNDVESPRNSFVLPAKLGLSQQPPPVSPNAEDLSLILGNVQGTRVRSYSTTISPKLLDNRITGQTTTSTTANVNTNANQIDSPQLDRKKSMPTNVLLSSNKTAAPPPTTPGTCNSTHNNSHNNSTAEEFFIDVILQKHARRLLSAHRLTDLGYFAAHLDFHLVAWLGKERERAARLDDVIQTLKQLHDEFQWPYPIPTGIISQQIADNTQQMNVEDRLKLLKLDVTTSSRVGDSGYTSFPGLPCTFGPITSIHALDPSNSQIADTEPPTSSRSDTSSTPNMADAVTVNATNYPLSGGNVNYPLSSVNANYQMPPVNVNYPVPTGNVNYYDKNIDLLLTNHNKSEHSEVKNNHNNAIMDDSMMSTVSSVWGNNNDDRDVFSNGANDNWEVPSSQILEQLSNTDSKGSQRAEVQLRYLLQLFMEAGCLEWSLIVSVLLRDVMAVLRTVNAAKSPDHSIETVSRLRQGLLLLHYWTNTECLGYKAFMLAIQNQLSVLTKILETKIQHKKIVDYQRAVSATLNKIATPRSRKSTLNHQDVAIVGGAAGVQETSKNKNSSTVTSASDKNDASVVNVPASALDDVHDNQLIPDSTGCIIA